MNPFARHRRAALALLGALPLTIACTADAVVDDDDVSLSGGDLSTSSGMSFSTGTGASSPVGAGAGGGAASAGATSATSAASSSAATTTGAGGGGGEGVCGDGTQDAGEACDDGNVADGDYCAGDCLAVTGSCGDGELQSNETCDDGVAVSCDTLHDGGDGTCLPAGQCVDGYFLSGGDCAPEQATADVLIDVSNTCVMNVTPQEFTVPAGQRLRLSYHNISNDYPVDVWKSYIGGYLDLATGDTWNEQYQHCSGPNAYTEYADISTACSEFRLLIHCL